MNLPLYRGNQAPERPPEGAHRGLWFERFFNQYRPDWSLPEAGDGDNPKKRFLDGIEGPCGDRDALRRVARRRIGLTEQLGGNWRTFVTDFHFVTGLGYPHPVENGLAWHPTLGVPYLPGSSVKGLVRAFCTTWAGWAKDDPRLGRWFGVGSGEAGADGAGALMFFEACPVEPPSLKVDIMTPHMGKWYEAGDDIQNPWGAAEGAKVPGDWHDPTPIPFLAVEQATFLFSVAPRPGCSEAEVTEALDVLEEALAWTGAGAKTAAGYGRMDRNTGGEEDLLQQREEARREEELAQLSPEERALREYAELLEQERAAGRMDRGSSPLTGQARGLMDRAEEEGWAAEQCMRLAER